MVDFIFWKKNYIYKYPIMVPAILWEWVSRLDEKIISLAWIYILLSTGLGFEGLNITWGGKLIAKALKNKWLHTTLQPQEWNLSNTSTLNRT